VEIQITGIKVILNFNKANIDHDAYCYLRYICTDAGNISALVIKEGWGQEVVQI